MAEQVTILSSTVQGQTGTKVIGPLLISSASPVFQIQDISVLMAESVVVTSPVGATLAIVVAPAGNGTLITLKGVSGDTGIPSAASGVVAVVAFNNPAIANSFTLTFAGAVTGGNVEVNFF